MQQEMSTAKILRLGNIHMQVLFMLGSPHHHQTTLTMLTSNDIIRNRSVRGSTSSARDRISESDISNQGG